MFASILLCIGATVIAEAQKAPPVSSEDSVVCIVDEINSSGHVYIVQPEGLRARVSRTSSSMKATEENAENGELALKKPQRSRTGYRVQVFDDNNPRTARSAANNIKAKMEVSFPIYNVYTAFDSPYWRVKVGDFRSRSEAESAMAEIRRAYPELKSYIRIVRDKINVNE